MTRRRKEGLVTGLSPSAVRAPDYQSLARFRYVIRQFLSYSDSITSAAGISSQQYQAILAIAVRPNSEASIKEIAEDMLLLPHGAVQLINRLEASKLVRRRKSPNDGRKVLVSLTTKGRSTLARLATDHAAELRRHQPLLAESLKRLRGISR